MATKTKPHGYTDRLQLDAAQANVRQAVDALSTIVQECPPPARLYQLVTVAALALAQATSALAEMDRIRRNQ